MANDATKLITDAKRWTQSSGLSPLEQKALTLDAWTKALSNLPGQADYTLGTTVGAPTVLSSAKFNTIFPAMGANLNSMDKDQVRAAIAQIMLVQAGVDNGSTSVLRTHSQYLMKLDEAQLDRCIMFVQSAFMEYVFGIL